MSGIVKPLVRFGVIAGLGTGAAVLIAGPHRVSALAHAVQGKIVSVIDSNIDDPTVLRAQLRELAEQYPERIADVRGDLAELQEQIRQVEREKQIGERVVALAQRDLDGLKDLLARADEARAAHGPGRVITVAFNDRDYKIDEAYARATQISQTKAAYQARVSDAERTTVYLKQQESRVNEMLTKLESEQADFNSQLWQIDHQVDAIARNDRLLEMLEKRQRQIDEYNRFDVVSVDQVKQRLTQIQAKQESQFKSLEKATDRLNYEQQAQQQIQAEETARSEFERATESISPSTKPANEIRIAPEAGEKDRPVRDAASVASSAPVRIH
ncbi:MAG: hypothetical protein AB7G17_10040 [Phycisphaerales bacterium]